jgi:hypothetical protein
MEVKMQTSFIPKKPIVESRPEGSGVSLFLLLSIIVFIVSLALAGLVFVYQNNLKNKIADSQKSLKEVRDTYIREGTEQTIQDLIRLDDRIEESKNLLAKHIAVTPLFILLQEFTIKNVQFKTMKFTYVDDKNIKLELTGIAKNYDALSKQADSFGDVKLRDKISQPVVSGFTLNNDGTVSFNFSAMVNFDLVSYEKIYGDSSATDLNNSTSTSEVNTI